ncbi:hypothetical protein SDC9_89198 [bioreactor metagenome]|uniref:Uncharacterized protein n=1 Tax=bioreactor metagenome TaxID=1076179 RepID=A0A644ZNW5_9ZZZZ
MTARNHSVPYGYEAPMGPSGIVVREELIQAFLKRLSPFVKVWEEFVQYRLIEMRNKAADLRRIRLGTTTSKVLQCKKQRNTRLTKLLCRKLQMHFSNVVRDVQLKMVIWKITFRGLLWKITLLHCC